MSEAGVTMRYKSIGSVWNANAFWMLVFAVMLGVYMIGMPKSGDDYWYMNGLQAWYMGQGILYPDGGGDVFSYGIPWDAIRSIWEHHYLTDNLRLANLVAPVVLLFPKWMGSGIAVLCLLVGFYKFGKISGIDMRRSALVPLGIVLLTFVMPWRDMMGGVDFQLNYFISTWLSAILISRAFSRNDKGRSGGITVGLLLGLLLGSWHEGFGLPVACGLTGSAVMDKGMRRGDVYGAVVGLLTGSLYVLSGPGMISRMTDQVGSGVEILSSGFVLYVGLPSIAICGLFVWAWRRIGFRRIVHDPLTVFCLVSGAASCVIMVSTASYCRGGWWFYLMLCFLAVYLLRKGGVMSEYTVRNVVLWVPLLVVAYVHLGACGYYTVKLRGEIKRQFDEWVSAPYRSRFGSLAQLSDYQWTCGYISVGVTHLPLYDAPVAWLTHDITDTSHYFDGGYADMRGGIPEALRYVKADSGRMVCEVSGDVPGIEGLQEKDGYLFMKEAGDFEEELRRKDISCSLRMLEINGDKARPYWQVSFVSEGDGKRYSYFRPQAGWYKSHFE